MQLLIVGLDGLSENVLRRFDVGTPFLDPVRATRTTMDRAFEIMDDVLDALDADVERRSRSRNWKKIGYHMRTTRMGKTPEASVVDPDCRTHDLENLYVASSSVLVTSGAVQPTLTIAALSLRLADHLEERIG